MKHDSCKKEWITDKGVSIKVVYIKNSWFSEGTFSKQLFESTKFHIIKYVLKKCYGGQKCNLIQKNYVI